MEKNRTIKIIIINILFGFLFSMNQAFAAPSNIILNLNDTEYYIVDANENEIPKGFETGKLANMGIVVRAYKNGPLTIVKISDEEYNYRFIAVDEKNQNKPYELILEEIDGVEYYIIPYEIEEYKKSDKGLEQYKTMVKDQIITCYSTNEHLYEKKVVYGIDSESNLVLLTYEENQDEFEIYDKVNNKQLENKYQNNNKQLENNYEESNNILNLMILIVLGIVFIIISRNKKEN